MKVTNNSLKELVNTSQEALSKEQNIVKCFQDQIPSNKVSFWSSFLHPWLPLFVSFFVFYVFVLLQGDISISSTRADVSLVSTGAKSEASFGSRTSKSSRKSVHHIQGQFYGAKLSAGAAVGFLQNKGWQMSTLVGQVHTKRDCWKESTTKRRYSFLDNCLTGVFHCWRRRIVLTDNQMSGIW